MWNIKNYIDISSIFCVNGVVQAVCREKESEYSQLWLGSFKETNLQIVSFMFAGDEEAIKWNKKKREGDGGE